jgi:hypothetical protein
MSDTSDHRIRAGDADRDRVVEALRKHHEAGRLAPEEFNERMEAALLARYLDELPPLLADLPSERAPGRDADDDPRAQWRHTWARRPSWPPYWPLPGLLMLLAVFAVIGSVAAVAHGHFPFPLLWLGFAFLWLGKWRSWRRADRFERHAGTARPWSNPPSRS